MLWGRGPHQLVTWDTDRAVDLGLAMNRDPGSVGSLSVPHKLDSVASNGAADIIAGGAA